ncbi:MAG: hypothetical protein A07HR60_02390 [uncultured archaeon A07HR60]|nr:MAG: hypothetical protein A07HR60_02390 [uncultured archaeon A07HR60]
MAGDDLNTTDRRILETLETGRATPGYLADELELERPSVSQRLAGLEDDGRVQKVARGLYEHASGETVHLPEDLADQIYEQKGRGMSYREHISKLVSGGGTDTESEPDSRISLEPESMGTEDMVDDKTSPPQLEDIADGTETTVDDASDHGVSSDSDSLDNAKAYADAFGELAGQGDLLVRRADAIMDMYDLLREQGSAEKSDFLEVVDPDEVNYEDPESVWSNMVKGQDTLKVLPGVETSPPGRSTWKYTGDE